MLLYQGLDLRWCYPKHREHSNLGHVSKHGRPHYALRKIDTHVSQEMAPFAWSLPIHQALI